MNLFLAPCDDTKQSKAGHQHGPGFRFGHRSQDDIVQIAVVRAGDVPARVKVVVASVMQPTVEYDDQSSAWL